MQGEAARRQVRLLTLQLAFSSTEHRRAPCPRRRDAAAACSPLARPLWKPGRALSQRLSCAACSPGARAFAPIAAGLFATGAVVSVEQIRRCSVQVVGGASAPVSAALAEALTACARELCPHPITQPTHSTPSNAFRRRRRDGSFDQKMSVTPCCYAVPEYGIFTRCCSRHLCLA